MRTISKFTGALLAVTGCGLLVGCSTPSTVSSLGFIANAGYAIRTAEERDAADFSPNELKAAREKLAEAERAFSAKQDQPNGDMPVNQKRQKREDLYGWHFSGGQTSFFSSHR